MRSTRMRRGALAGAALVSLLASLLVALGSPGAATAAPAVAAAGKAESGTTRVVPAASRRVTVQHRKDGYCLDSHNNGVPYTRSCVGSQNQKWFINPDSAGNTVYLNGATADCLDANYNGDVYTTRCGFPNEYQKWNII